MLPTHLQTSYQRHRLVHVLRFSFAGFFAVCDVASSFVSWTFLMSFASYFYRVSPRFVLYLLVGNMY